MSRSKFEDTLIFFWCSIILLGFGILLVLILFLNQLKKIRESNLKKRLNCKYVSQQYITLITSFLILISTVSIFLTRVLAIKNPSKLVCIVFTDVAIFTYWISRRFVFCIFFYIFGSIFHMWFLI